MMDPNKKPQKPRAIRENTGKSGLIYHQCKPCGPGRILQPSQFWLQPQMSSQASHVSASHSALIIAPWFHCPHEYREVLLSMADPNDPVEFDDNNVSMCSEGGG